MIDSLFADVAEFSGKGNPSNDMTVCIVKVQ
jgi:hypothetical protein